MCDGDYHDVNDVCGCDLGGDSDSMVILDDENNSNTVQQMIVHSAHEDMTIGGYSNERILRLLLY